MAIGEPQDLEVSETSKGRRGLFQLPRVSGAPRCCGSVQLTGSTLRVRTGDGIPSSRDPDDLALGAGGSKGPATQRLDGSRCREGLLAPLVHGDVAGELDTGCHAELLETMPEVTVHSVRREKQLTGNLTVGQPFSDEPSDS